MAGSGVQDICSMNPGFRSANLLITHVLDSDIKRTRSISGSVCGDRCNRVRQGQWCCAGHLHLEGTRGYTTTWQDKSEVYISSQTFRRGSLTRDSFEGPLYPPLHTVSRDTVSHLHSHVVPRTIFCITVTLSVKEHSPRIKNHYVIQFKTRTKQNQHTPLSRTEENGNSPLINSYHDTNENTHNFTMYTCVEEFLPSNSFVQLRSLKITAGNCICHVKTNIS